MICSLVGLRRRIAALADSIMAAWFVGSIPVASSSAFVCLLLVPLLRRDPRAYYGNPDSEYEVRYSSGRVETKSGAEIGVEKWNEDVGLYVGASLSWGLLALCLLGRDLLVLWRPFPPGRWTVTGGLPDEPEASMEAVCDVKGPGSFLRALFETCCQVDVGKTSLVGTAQTSVEGEEEVSLGRCGTERIGLRFKEIRNLESSMFPMQCEWESYGLPGMGIRWAFSLEKAGQMGYSAFRHGTLEVDFQDSAGRRRFEKVWQKVFGRKPILARKAAVA